MIRLKPPVHSVPDNVWHTLLIAFVASFFLWVTGQKMIELVLVDGPVNLLEQKLLDGEGHPLQRWLSSFEWESSPLLWNRIFSFTGWMLALGHIFRFLKKSSGFVGSLPALIILLTLPGLSVYMCSAGSGSWGVYLFLKAFTLISETETSRDLVRGGLYAGIAVLLAPVWFLPSVGLIVGSWEIFRARFKWVAAGFLAAGLTGGLLFFFLSSNGLEYLFAGPAVSNERNAGWMPFLSRYLFLVTGLVLLLVYGARRRGVGWWTLIFCLPFLVLEPRLASGYAELLIPFWVLVSVGLNKIAIILDIRFPRAYQSIFLCQLLLWLPAYLGLQAFYIYPALNF